MSTSEPAEATRPARVRISGRPAATRAPKASTRMARVTGQENISDFSIASRLASLKSDQSSEAPVGLTSTPSPERASSWPLRSSATRTISLGSAPAPARMTAVSPSWLSVAPGWGAMTSAMRGSSSRMRGDLGQDLRAGALGDRAVGAVHDDLDRGAGVAAEVLLGELAGGDGLRAVGLPAGAGEVGLDLGREGAEADDEQQPHDGGEPGVVGDPDAEPAQRAGAVADGRGRASGRVRRGGGGPSRSWQELVSVSWCRA